MKTLLFFTCLAGFGHASNILAVFPMFAKSHQNIFQPVILGLADKGHNVTYVTGVPLKKPHPNVQEIVIPELKSDPEETKKMFDIPVVLLLRYFGQMLLNVTFSNKEVQAIIKSEDLHYDLVLLETTFCMEPLIAFSHKFNAPAVEIVPSGNFLWTYWLHGNPHDTSYMADVMGDNTDKMTFVERLKNTVLFQGLRIIWCLFIPTYQRIMDEHMVYPGWESRPSMIEMIRNNISLVLENTHVSLRPAAPRSPNFKDIAGIHLQKPQPLPKDLKKFMDEASDGVIYFTMGSHLPASSIFGETVKKEFLKAFSKLKQKVLWKWETDIPEAPVNVKVGQWFPQQDILAHQNIKAFITHGGFLSQTEAVSNGVPLIVIPFMGDQPLNARIIEESGYGVKLQLGNITDESISWALNEILTHESYKENAIKYSKLLMDRREAPLETAIYWIEYVIRHKGAHHLTPYVVNLYWWQEALLDVYLTLFIILAVPTYLLYRLGKCCICNICGNFFCSKTKVNEQKKDKGQKSSKEQKKKKAE